MSETLVQLNRYGLTVADGANTGRWQGALIRSYLVVLPTEPPHTTARKPIMTDPKYKAFTALDPFFDIVKQGLAGHRSLMVAKH